jgi:hypothetical protein
MQFVNKSLFIDCMNANTIMSVLRYLFGTANRAGTTVLCALVLWGIIDPTSVRSFIALCWNNFWEAFEPLLYMLLQFAIMVGALVFISRKVFGGSRQRR